MKGSVDFDPYAPDIVNAGPKAWADFGRQRPLFHYRGKFDFYISSDYQDIKSGILRDNETWLYSKGTSPKMLDPRLACGMMTDPPHHHGIRAIVQRGFAPRRLERLALDIDTLMDELIDAMLAMPETQGNFFDLFAMPLAARLMCIMLGAPEGSYRLYKDWADDFMYDIFNNVSDSAEAAQKGQLMAESLALLIANRRNCLEEQGVEPTLEHVGTLLPDDFISRFICDKVDGRYLTEWEIISLLLSIINGGNETTMNLICNLLWRLLENPELWAAVKAQPALVPLAVEESLRFDPPVIGMFRTTAQSTELQGEIIPANNKVMYNIAAANRDPAVWDNPDEFRLDRELATLRQHHVSFSGGSHLCLGFGLARMEVRQVLEKLVVRLPDLRLIGEPRRAPGFNFWGHDDLPVAWD